MGEVVSAQGAEVVTTSSGRTYVLAPRLTGETSMAAYRILSARRIAHFAKRRILLDMEHRLECAAAQSDTNAGAWELRKQATEVRKEYDALCLQGYK